MKKRLLSLVLAASMIFGSLNVSFADEASVSDDAVIAADEAVDEVASGDAVEAPVAEAADEVEALAAPEGQVGPYAGEDGELTYWDTTSPWKAAVYGDAGGQTKIDNLGNPDFNEYKKDASGNTIYTYDVQENGNSVTLRMGAPDPTDNTLAPVDSQGKMSDGSEGRLMYYQKLTADDDFTISATAHINGINSNASSGTPNQVSFGAAVLNTFDPFVHTGSVTPDDSVNAGAWKIGDANGKGPTNLVYSFVRKGGAIESFKNTEELGIEVPKAGMDIPISIKKSGKIYTMSYAGQTTTYDGADLVMEDDIYVGFYVSRCADVTFNNVRLSIVGAAVEMGDWIRNGNGMNCWTDKVGIPQITATPDDTNPTDITFDLSGNTGKLSSSEDSYSYYAAKAPAGEDFKFSTRIEELSVASESNKQQAFTGLVVFDEQYSKDSNTPSIEGVKQNTTQGPALFVGAGFMSSTSEGYNLYYRIVDKSGKITTSAIDNRILGGVGAMSGPFDISLNKSGDIIKLKVNDFDTIDINVAGLFENNQYIGYCIARDGHIKATNNSLSVGTKKVSSINIATQPDKTEYFATEKFDATGMVLEVVYADGTTELISDPEEYNLTGFDDVANKSFNTPGTKTVNVSIGSASVPLEITVRAKKVTNIHVDYAPIYDTYYAGGRFNTIGLQVTAMFEDGTSKVLSASEYKITAGDVVLKNGDTVPASIAGDDIAFVVSYTDTDESIDPNGMTDVFNAKVQPGVLESIKILTYDFRDTYYVGQTIGVNEGDTIPEGLTVEGVFRAPDGTTSTQFIPSDLWEVVGFDTSKPVDKEVLTIRLKDDHSISTTYTIRVIEKFPITRIYESYPRFTYAVDESFSLEGLDISILYSDNSKIIADAQAYYYKTADGYFKEYRVDDTSEAKAFVKGDVVSVSEAEALAADFYVDLSNYVNKEVGTTSVEICVNEKYGGASGTDTYNVSIVDKQDYVWKAMIFGASSLGVKQTDEPSNMTATYTDGTQEVSDATAHGIKPALMENGELSQIGNIRVRSWGGAGKISGDQDGIAYYYTTVDATKNFSLTADIHVNNYIADPNNLSTEQAGKYNQYIVEENGDVIKALDRLRSGQEAFGMMARDIIPYGGSLIDGEYTGGATSHMTPYPDEAPQKEYTFTRQNGETVTYTLPVDLYEAYRTGNYPDGYAVTRENVEAQITSNMIIAGGCTDSTYPTDPSSSSYYKKSTMNRINIMTRYGVTSTSGGGERVGIHATTDHVPAAGDDYTITLTKMNTGYFITTYDHTTGITNTQYSFEDIDETGDALEKQDAENIYVGFFASRYADITVSNIKLSESLTATDPIITGNVDETTRPNVTVVSPYYTTLKDYTLILKSNCSSDKVGGVTNIYMNGKTIVKDNLLGSKDTAYDVELVPDYVNQFSVVYYPNTADDKFVSYDPVITRFTVTHKSLTDTSKLYVGPNGSVKGDATRENPITLEIAMAIVDFGGEVIMLDGTYHKNNRDVLDIEIPLSYSGIPNGGFKTLRADEGAHPVIDLESQFAGFNVDADYWYFKGIEMKNSVDNEKAFGLGGNHVVVEDCVFHDNGTTGFQISRINSKDELIVDWPSFNLIKSCESFNNMDSSKNNADGFAAKLTVGYGNVYEDCISHHNLDDGWDCYTKINSGAIGPVVLENCITYKQGYRLQEDGSDSDFLATSGGNGYKLGGEGIYVKHMLKDCIAFNCKANGIDTNNNPALKLRNVITYDNSGYNFSLYSNTPDSLVKDGSGVDEEGRVYKYDYDMEGVVSAGTRSVDRIGSLNYEAGFGNISEKPMLSEKNYLKVAPEGIFLEYSYKDGNSDKTEKLLNESDYKGAHSIPSSNGYVKDSKLGSVTGKDGLEHTYTNFSLSEGADTWDDATDFKSTDFLATAPGQRYQRNEDGSYNHGDFLARVESYEHNAEDIVTLPDYLGGEGGVGLGETESTSSPVVQPSTQGTTSSGNHGSGGGGGGGRGPATTTTAATTEATTEAGSEATTDDSTAAKVDGSVLTVPVEVKIDSKDIKVDGKTYTMDVAPYIQTASNSTMVPLRFVAIALAGGDIAKADETPFISWDAATKTATINAGANKIAFVAGSRVYTVNGNNFNIANQAVAEIVDGRMFVPFRTIGQALGVPVGWDAETKTASYNEAETK